MSLSFFCYSQSNLLAYYKCKDDWENEKKRTGKIYGQLLQKGFERIEKEYPRQSKCVKESLKKLSEIEKSALALPDDAVNCSGMMLSEIFVYNEDFWSEELRRFGYELGRFIYLMDAALDYSKDQRRGNYNPLFLMKKKPEEVEDILLQMIGSVTVQFEKFPIEQDINVMRNILYAKILWKILCNSWVNLRKRFRTLCRTEELIGFIKNQRVVILTSL